MNLTLPKFRYQLFIIACAAGVLFACSGPGRDTIYIYNPSKDAITITIDDEPVAIPADSSIRKTIDIGKHTVKYNNRIDTLDVTGNTNVLVNPTKARLIKSEMLYQTEYIKNGKASDEDYSTPLTTMIIDSLRYGGHFTLTDDVVINDWYFYMDEKPGQSVDANGYMRRGVQSGNNGGNPTMLSSYKLYTLDEFTENTIPLNRDKHYIEFILKQHLTTLTNADYIFVNAGSLLAGQNKEELADMGKIHVTNNNEIYLKKPYLYNKAEHGKIIDTLYTLNDCIVEFDSVNIKYIKEIAFVKTKESLPLRLVIR
jgi:hypothetical protein